MIQYRQIWHFSTRLAILSCFTKTTTSDTRIPINLTTEIAIVEATIVSCEIKDLEIIVVYKWTIERT